MLIVGYCYSIRSERRLCQEVKMNLAYRWFCGLGLEDKVPDHSTFSVNRHGRFRESDILRKVFEEVVCGCMTAGLVGGEGFAVDASVIEADASRFQRVKGSEVDWTPEQRTSRPVREYLVALESENPPINPNQKTTPQSGTSQCRWREPSTVPIANVLPYKQVTLMRTMRLVDNCHHRFKRWFVKEV